MNDWMSDYIYILYVIYMVTCNMFKANIYVQKSHTCSRSLICFEPGILMQISTYP